jgi:hypothetical protein
MKLAIYHVARMHQKRAVSLSISQEMFWKAWDQNRRGSVWNKESWAHSESGLVLLIWGFPHLGRQRGYLFLTHTMVYLIE